MVLMCTMNSFPNSHTGRLMIRWKALKAIIESRFWCHLNQSNEHQRVIVNGYFQTACQKEGDKSERWKERNRRTGNERSRLKYPLWRPMKYIYIYSRIVTKIPTICKLKILFGNCLNFCTPIIQQFNQFWKNQMSEIQC